jgi:hypothetical protein
LFNISSTVQEDVLDIVLENDIVSGAPYSLPVASKPTDRSMRIPQFGFESQGGAESRKNKEMVKKGVKSSK